MKTLDRFAAPRSRAGFSLIELVVVLVVLGILAGMAVPRMSGTLDVRRESASRDGLEAIQEAVLGDAYPRAVSGFYADMGRAPRAVRNADGRHSLSELWECPTDAAYTIVSPTEDPDVALGVGWRGPYLELRGDEPVDAWGTEYTDDVHAAGDERHLILNAEGSITAVRRFDIDGNPQELPLIPEKETVLVVTVQALDPNGAASLQDLGTVAVRVYQPDPAHPGRLDSVQTTSASSASVRTLRIESGLLPGRRVLRVSSSTRGVVLKEIDLAPGENHVWQAFTIPFVTGTTSTDTPTD